nr:NAD(+)-glycohydrolase - bovine (fragments) [Bos taurus]
KSILDGRKELAH